MSVYDNKGESKKETKREIMRKGVRKTLYKPFTLHLTQASMNVRPKIEVRLSQSEIEAQNKDAWKPLSPWEPEKRCV